MNATLPMPDGPVRVVTGLGTLLLYPQRFGDIGALAEPAPGDAAGDRLRRFFARVAAPENSNAEGPGAPRLDATAAALSDDDLEQLADAYLRLPGGGVTVPGDAPDAATATVAAPGERAAARLDRLLQSAHDRQLDDLRGTFDALRHPGDASLPDALAELERQAAALRMAADAVAGDAGAAAPVEAGTSPEERARRLQHDAIELSRSVARLTARSALLLAGLTEASSGHLRRFLDGAGTEARHAQRRIMVLAGIAAAFAIGATALGAALLLQERDNAREVQRLADVVARTQQDQAAVAAERSAIDARLREIAERQVAESAATAAVHRSVVAALPAPPSPDAAVPAHPANKAAASKAPKRKVTR